MHKPCSSGKGLKSNNKKECWCHYKNLVLGFTADVWCKEITADMISEIDVALELNW